VSAVRVTLTPDTSNWPKGGPAWDSGIQQGVWREFTDPGEAQEFIALAEGLGGWTVEQKHLEEV
jgi:hypothetical protein